MPIEIRVTRPERYSMIEPNLSARQGYYFSGRNQQDAINKATIEFKSEVIDVEINHGRYLGAFKRVDIHGPDECFVQLPHTIPGMTRIEQLLAGFEGNITVCNGVLTFEDGTQHQLKGGNQSVKDRLEYLRGEIVAERISYGEISELQSLVNEIPEEDVLLLQWAGKPEFDED